MPDIGSATVLEVGLSVLQRAAPKGLAAVKSWIYGKQVVILGPPRAGKTTLVDYLQYGIFEEEKETSKTPEKRRTPRFDVKMGRDGALELNVKSALDVPGQYGAVAHADTAFDYRAHAIVIVLDLTSPLKGKSENSSCNWVYEFCRRLETKWRVRGKRGNRLKSMIVLLNKADKVDKRRITSCQKALRKILDQELRQSRGNMTDPVEIRETVLVTNPRGTEAVDGIVTHLAKQLARGQ